MNQKVATMRALIAYTALKALRLVTVIVLLAFLVVIGVIWGLAYYVSAWWWLFAVPIVLLLCVFFVIRFIAMRTIHLIHRHPFTEQQRNALEVFSDKCKNLIETTSTPMAVHAFYVLRDIILHQDVKTLREAIQDSTSLKKDFTSLEKYFGER